MHIGRTRAIDCDSEPFQRKSPSNNKKHQKPVGYSNGFDKNSVFSGSYPPTDRHFLEVGFQVRFPGVKFEAFFVSQFETELQRGNSQNRPVSSF